MLLTVRRSRYTLLSMRLIEKTTAERLRAARQQRGLTQAELAARTGVRQSAISHFETGRASPSLKTLARIALSLEISTAQLINESAEVLP